MYCRTNRSTRKFSSAGRGMAGGPRRKQARSAGQQAAAAGEGAPRPGRSSVGGPNTTCSASALGRPGEGMRLSAGILLVCFAACPAGHASLSARGAADADEICCGPAGLVCDAKDGSEFAKVCWKGGGGGGGGGGGASEAGRRHCPPALIPVQSQANAVFSAHPPSPPVLALPSPSDYEGAAILRAPCAGAKSEPGLGQPQHGARAGRRSFPLRRWDVRHRVQRHAGA
eukprot:SAG22_NODE_5759_length_958_cov_1.342258_1_plen_228_part_00